MPYRNTRMGRLWERFDNHRFAAAWAIFAVIFFLFYLHPRDPGDRIDIIISALIFSVYTLSAVVMLLGTSIWSMRSMGLFFTAIGNAMLYGVVCYQAVTHNILNEGWLDFARAAYLVGGPLVMFGLGVWVFVNWLPGPKDKRKGKRA